MNKSQWHIRRDRIPQLILVVVIGAIPLSYAIAWFSHDFRVWQAGGDWCARFHPDGSEEIRYGSECGR